MTVKKIRSNYSTESNRLYLEFKKDALEDVGLDKHPKVDKIFNYAWVRGHSEGYQAVYGYLVDLADMLS